MTTDKVFESFLEAQYEEAMALTAASDLLELTALGTPPHRCYVAVFHCRGLVRSDKGDVTISNRFEVGIHFPPDYLRRAEPAQVLHWLTPNAFHPNIRHPFICVGRLGPGTSLADILYQVFDVVTGKKMTVREDDALCPQACEFARNHPEMFPVDRRPLKRRRVSVSLVSHDAADGGVKHGGERCQTSAADEGRDGNREDG